MEFHSLGFLISASLKELLAAADGFHMSAFTFPYVKRSSPVTVTADSPVLNVLQPVAETSFSDALRDPVNGIVIPDQIVLYSGHLNKPGLPCIVDKGRITSPAVRIAVFKLRRREKQPSLIQIFEYFRVCLFAERSGPGSFLCHLSFFIYQLEYRKIIFLSYFIIVFTESRSDVYHAGTVCKRYISIADYIISLFI